MQPQTHPNDGIEYAGRDLEAMVFATNYYRWILQIFTPYLGRRVVEVGAGTGSFSELILERPIESLSLVEPALTMYERLAERIGRLAVAPSITTYHAVFDQVAERIKSAQQPDSIIYVNVLEHIPDDDAELKAVHQTLQSGGRMFVFVPALRWLFGRFDREIGHCRRYTKVELEAKCRRAGFTILHSSYFDFAGIAPWWITFCLLRSTTMTPRVVRWYDKCVVPASRAVEAIISPPVGRNLILVAEKN